MHWNAPPLAKSRLFCIKALKHHFGERWRTAFVHTSERDHHGLGNGSKRGAARKASAFAKSATIERELAKKPRLSCMAE